MKIFSKNGALLLEVPGSTLSDANLRGANLSGANLRGANLSYVDLRDVDLSDVDLSDADLSGANLRDANLSYVDLRDVDLSDANLRGANLRDADLRDANLRYANLSGADLRDADLSGANLRDANLSGAKNYELSLARCCFLPDGDIIGWKKCRNNVIVKLLIPADAKKTHAFSRKCRAEYAKILEIFGGTKAVSMHDPNFIYKVGEVVRPHDWCDDWTQECAGGIHFYITRIEAENH